MSHTNNRRRVALYRSGHHLWLTPPENPASKALVTLFHLAEPDDQHGYSVGRRVCDLWSSDELFGQPAASMYAGLEPAATEILSRCGYAVDRYCLPRPLPAPRQREVARFKNADTPLIDLVRAHERALIRYRPGQVEVARLVAQIARAWPKHSIAVAVTRTEEARWLCGQVRQYLPDTLAYTHRDKPAGSTQVAVSTWLELANARVDERDILIAADAVEATGENPHYYHQFATRARYYGLVPMDQPIAPHDLDRIRSMFGFVELAIPKHGHRERLVWVVQTKIAGGPPMAPGSDVLGVKRQGIWAHPVRNRRIAKLARAFQAGDADLLRGWLPTLDSASSAGKSVLVLVEGVDHAGHLARRLPDWQVRAASTDPGTAATQSRTPGAGAIVTMTALTRRDLDAADVLIRADGGPGLPPIDDRNLIEPVSVAARPLLLVDFDDRHNPLLRRWSRWRWQAYPDACWYEPGVDPVRLRVDRFVSLRMGQVKS